MLLPRSILPSITISWLGRMNKRSLHFRMSHILLALVFRCSGNVSNTQSDMRHFFLVMSSICSEAYSPSLDIGSSSSSSSDVSWGLYDSIQFNSIQFNSIQYRHLYAPANEHHVGAHGEETKLQRKIKYMNDKRKKSVNFEKVRFQFCSEGVERESGSRKSTGSEFHTADEA